MKKVLLTCFFVSAALFAMATSPTPATSPAVPGVTQEMIIDNFDDADVTLAPSWWLFDRVRVAFPEAPEKKHGLYYLKVTGKAEGYYVGGMGTYIAKDASGFDTWVMDVLGNGPGTGTIKIQMLDDDNGNYQVEQDSKYEPLYDDRVEYELPVTWTGWQTVEIPFNKFVDTNPGLGDDVFNPEQKNGSGGLIQAQLIFLTQSPTANLNVGIDNVRLIKKSQ
jgi:hypothetical protein